MPSMSSLSLYAGPVALASLRSEGLRADSFTVIAGASGGPKWFVLQGLDRYLFGEFFAQRRNKLMTIGSSAGAWRLACMAQSDPVAAIDRLANLYSQEAYSAKPTKKEVTLKARAMLREVLGADGGKAIINHPVIESHFIAGRGRGLLSTPHDMLLGAGMAMAAFSNLINRRSLGWYFERIVFTNRQAGEQFGLDDIPTQYVRLTEANVHDALLASGSIPFVLEGVRDVEGAGQGLYVDGGITDYHLDIPFSVGDGLVLYPHFYPRVIPGWFDKSLPWRNVRAHNYDNVLLVVPSQEFVASLPYGKIPDREDFRKLDYTTRVKYWQKVLAESQRCADDFAELVHSQCVSKVLQAFDIRKDN